MHATLTASQATKPTPTSAGPGTNARAIVQAQCNCGPVAASGEGGCTACAGVPEVRLQAAPLPGHDFARIRVNAATAADSFADRNDPLELEADRTAGQVLRRLAALPAHVAAPAGGPGAPPPVPGGLQSGPPGGSVPSIAVQRQADPDETAADAAADAAMAGPALEAAPDAEASGDSGAGAGDPADAAGDSDDDDGGAPVQAASLRDAVTRMPTDLSTDLRTDLQTSIAQSRGAGHALPAALRAGMETAFGADFSAVRIHADARAGGLAEAIHARAFATGSDIYFGAGHYDPASDTGRRLLAHELTHVLQQGAAPAAAAADAANAPAVVSRAATGTLQRAPKKPAPAGPAASLPLGEFYFFNANGDTLSVVPVTQDYYLGLRPGYYEVKFAPMTGADFEVTGTGVGTQIVRAEKPADVKQLLARTDRVFLLVYGKAVPATPNAAPEATAARDKRSADDPTGPARQPGADAPEPQPQQGQGSDAAQEDGGKEERREDEGKPDAGQGGKLPAGPDAGDKNGGADKDKKDDRDGKQGGGLGTSPGKGGGLPGQQQKKGSKYGVFNLFNLPQPLVDFLETALEALGEADEVKAMSETLLMLKELAEHRDGLADLFKDPETLIEIALGLKENAAITAIENWVNKAPVKSKAAPRVKHKGIAALGAKLVATAAKLRKVLKPVFKIRSTVQAAMGGVGLILEAVPALETLLDLAKDPGKFSELDVNAAVDDFAVDFAAQIKLKLDFAPKALRAGIEKFAESDLVSYEELARAVTAALLLMVPKPYRPVVKGAKAIGLDTAIADNVIAPLIPKDALDGINGVLRSLIALVTPTLESAAGIVQKIVDELAPGFLAELPAEVRKIVKPSRHGRGPARRSSVRAIAGLVDRSAGTPLDDDTRGAAETAMGQPFGAVRVHTDAAAGAASERLGANAFAIGSDVYFGPNRYDPVSTGGRRLLYHELAHTAQQQQGGIALQPDYKELLGRLARRFSDKVIAELRGASTTSPAKQKQIADITDKATKLIGRTVVSPTNPALPTGYSYVLNSKKKIQTIRRALTWIRFIPALTIAPKTRKIRLAALLSRFDPKAPMRRALRAALGCSSTQEAHHLVPLELYFNDVVAVAMKNGFSFNGTDNGLCVSNKVHAGSHPIYSAGVLSRMNALKASFGLDWSRLAKPFGALVADLRADVKKRRSKLK